MSVPPEIFDEDYLYFYAGILGPERSEADAELVARLLELRPRLRVLDVPCGEGRIAGRLARRGCEVVGVDAIVNWFTSFGYFDRQTNDAVLRDFARALRPGGQLLLELHNPGRLERLVELAGGSSASVLERDGNLVVDRVTYDRADGLSRTERFIVRDGRVRRLEFRLEQIPAPELVRRLRTAGFEEVRLFGQAGAEFEPDGRRLIALARR